MRRRMHVALLAGAVAGVVGCGQAELTVYQPVPVPAGGINCTFTDGVLPVIRNPAQGYDCASASCHAPSSPIAGLILQGSDDVVYASLRSAGSYGPAVDTTNVQASLLLQAPLSGSIFNQNDHHPQQPFAGIADPGYQAFQCWIAAGALR